MVSEVRVRAQDGQLQRASAEAVAAAQLGHEGRDLLIGQGGVMLDPADLRGRGQHLVEMPAPARGILAVAQAAALGPGQHPLDPAAQARCRLGAGGPQRGEHAQHEVGVDVLHRQVCNGAAILRERHPPLLAVLVVLPRDLVGGEVGFDALAEAHGLGGFESLLGTVGPPGLQWVDVVKELLAQAAGLVPGLAQPDRMERAQPHLPAAAAALVAEQPRAPDRAVSAERTLQVEIAAIGQERGLPTALRLGVGNLP